MTFYAPTTHDLRPHQHYPTPVDLARALPLGLAMAGLELPRPVYDPCCGEGALLDALGGLTRASDLYPDAYRGRVDRWTTPVDARDPAALIAALGTARSIATNPPYGRDAEPIVRACVKLVDERHVELAAVLVPLPWEAAGSRSDLMARVSLRIVPCWRSVWVPGTKGGGKMNYVWLVWTWPWGAPLSLRASGRSIYLHRRRKSP